MVCPDKDVYSPLFVVNSYPAIPFVVSCSWPDTATSLWFQDQPSNYPIVGVMPSSTHASTP
jgi:hypothetical protein